MILRLFSAVALTFLCGLNALAAGQPPGPSRLGGSTVAWNGDRLTVALKNAPVKRVLQDLMTSDGYTCQVTGDIQGSISMAIEDLTVSQTIHRIMRNRRLSYTMIHAEPGSPGGNRAVVSELTIYQDKSVIRFVNIPGSGGPAVQPTPADLAPAPIKPLPAEPSVPDPATTEEALKDLDEEIKTLMDEMLAEDKISKPEYDELLETINSGKDTSSP